MGAGEQVTGVGTAVTGVQGVTGDVSGDVGCRNDGGCKGSA